LLRVAAQEAVHAPAGAGGELRQERRAGRDHGVPQRDAPGRLLHAGRAGDRPRRGRHVGLRQRQGGRRVLPRWPREVQLPVQHRPRRSVQGHAEAAAPGLRGGVHAALSRAGLAWLAVVIGAWGLTWPVSKVILASLPPPPRADVPVLTGIALLHMAGFGLLASVGLQLVPTGRSVVLAYTTPLWVAPGAALFLGERLTARRALGVVIGLLGLLALFNPLAFDWTAHAAVLGNLAILAAALLWAASILQIRGHAWRTAPLDVLPWSLALATLVTSLVALAVEG